MWKLAARGMKVGMAAGSIVADPAVAAAAAASTSDSAHPQSSPSQPVPAANALVLPASKTPTTAISMTAALKNVGAVSTKCITSSVTILFC